MVVKNSRGALNTPISELIWEKSHLVNIDQDVALFKVSLLIHQLRFTLFVNFSFFTLYDADFSGDAVTWHQDKFEALIIIE